MKTRAERIIQRRREAEIQAEQAGATGADRIPFMCYEDDHDRVLRDQGFRKLMGNDYVAGRYEWDRRAYREGTGPDHR